MARQLARAALVLALVVAAACSRPPAPKHYQLKGQILAVLADRQQLTIKHGDIEGLMPGMTMSFPVASPDLMKGRTAGELITATLEVGDNGARLVEITHIGSAPLPEHTNEAELVAGLLSVGDETPDAALIDQDNRRRSLAEWRGTITLITFIYTSCPLPNFCPLMDQNFARIQAAVAATPALAGKVKLISISFDPDRDTPEVLARHAAGLHADPAVWTFLTGDRVTVDRLAAKFGVGVIRDDSDQIAHNLRTTLVGADGRIVRIYSGSDWTPSGVMADITALAK
jgi:protein SCO1/2